MPDNELELQSEKPLLNSGDTQVIGKKNILKYSNKGSKPIRPVESKFVTTPERSEKYFSK